MEIDHHIAEAQALLEEVLAGAPDVARFDRLKICQEWAFVQKLVDGGQLTLDGAVIDQNICVFGAGVEGLHLERGGGLGVFVGFEIAEGIGPPGQLDGLGHVVPRLADGDAAAVGDGKKGHGLSRHGKVGKLLKLICLCLEAGRRLRCLPQEDAAKFHPLHPPQGVALVARSLHEDGNAEALQLLLDLRGVVDHGVFQGQVTAFGENELIVRGAVLPGVGHGAVFHRVLGLRDVPVIRLEGGQGHVPDAVQRPEKVHGARGGEIDIVEGLLDDGHLFRHITGNAGPFGDHETAAAVLDVDAAVALFGIGRRKLGGILQLHGLVKGQVRPRNAARRLAAALPRPLAPAGAEAQGEGQGQQEGSQFLERPPAHQEAGSRLAESKVRV